MSDLWISLKPFVIIGGPAVLLVLLFSWIGRKQAEKKRKGLKVFSATLGFSAPEDVDDLNELKLSDIFGNVVLSLSNRMVSTGGGDRVQIFELETQGRNYSEETSVVVWGPCKFRLSNFDFASARKFDEQKNQIESVLKPNVLMQLQKAVQEDGWSIGNLNGFLYFFKNRQRLLEDELESFYKATKHLFDLLKAGI